MSFLLPALALLVWTASSSYIIILNKRLMVDDGFKFPLMLTAIGQGTSWLGGLVLAKLGVMPCRGSPKASFFVQRLLPVVLCSAGSMALGNFAYLSLSMAFIQVLKVLTPAVTLTVCLMFGLEGLTPMLALSITIITAGTGIAALVESQSGSFSVIGFTAFVISVVLESLRVVCIQLLVGKLAYNAVEALVYLSPAIAGALLIGSFIWEWDGLTAPHGGFAKIAEKPLQYAVAALTGFAVNITTYWAIKVTSSLTFKVLGCVKNSLVVWFGILLGDTLSGSQLLGYGLSVAGFCLYTWTKTKAPRLQNGARKPRSKKVA
jgi:hypothetical protein